MRFSFVLFYFLVKGVLIKRKLFVLDEVSLVISTVVGSIAILDRFGATGRIYFFFFFLCYVDIT